MEKPIATRASLPHPALPGANWADCYTLRTATTDLTAGRAARLAIGMFPWWVRALMRIRNAVAALFGLKPAVAGARAASESIGIFPVVSETPDEIVLGFDDRHLDFRIVMGVEPASGNGQIVRMTTLVDRKILLGRIYIALVTPFHKFIVARTLSDFGARISAVNPPA